MDKVELVKFEKKDLYKEKKDGMYVIEEKYNEKGELVFSSKNYYIVHTMGEDMYLKVSFEQYENIKKLLNDQSVRFVEIKDNLVAVHQITSIEKKRDVNFSRL